MTQSNADADRLMEQQRLGTGNYAPPFEELDREPYNESEDTETPADTEDTNACKNCGHYLEDHVDYNGPCGYCECIEFTEA